MSWLRRSVASLSPLRLHMIFIVKDVAVGETFLRMLLFPTNGACLSATRGSYQTTNGRILGTFLPVVSTNNTHSEIRVHWLESTCFHRFFRQVSEHQTTFPFTFKWPSLSFITWHVMLGPVKCHRFLGVAARRAQPVVNRRCWQVTAPVRHRLCLTLVNTRLKHKSLN